MSGFTPEHNLTVPSLSPAERRWVSRLAQLMGQQPERLEFVVCGDRHFQIIDKEGADRSELCDGAALADGIVLATLEAKGRWHGVSA